eukprot:COSAG06_NODE_3275_length_5577_cov_6.602410_2_plen_73_part_00
MNDCYIVPSLDLVVARRATTTRRDRCEGTSRKRPCGRLSRRLAAEADAQRGAQNGATTQFERGDHISLLAIV